MDRWQGSNKYINIQYPAMTHLQAHSMPAVRISPPPFLLPPSPKTMSTIDHLYVCLIQFCSISKFSAGLFSTQCLIVNYSSHHVNRHLSENNCVWKVITYHVNRHLSENNCVWKVIMINLNQDCLSNYKWTHHLRQCGNIIFSSKSIYL